MPNEKQSYTLKHALSSIFMLLALVWLTVCLPYVNQSRQVTQTQIESTSDEAPGSNDNPLSNTTEEKTEPGSSLFSEYLHDLYFIDQSFINITSFYKCHPSDLYLAYHPKLIIPPPEA